MSDAAFLAAFESGALAGLHHRDHLRLTWLYLRRDGVGVGTQRVIDGIKRFAAARGASSRYNETLTRAWIHLVASATDAADDGYERAIARCPELLSTDYPLRFYRVETLRSAAARERWIAPDLAELP